MSAASDQFLWVFELCLHAVGLKINIKAFQVSPMLWKLTSSSSSPLLSWLWWWLLPRLLRATIITIRAGQSRWRYHLRPQFHHLRRALHVDEWEAREERVRGNRRVCCFCSTFIAWTSYKESCEDLGRWQELAGAWAPGVVHQLPAGKVLATTGSLFRPHTLDMRCWRQVNLKHTTHTCAHKAGKAQLMG